MRPGRRMRVDTRLEQLVNRDGQIADVLARCTGDGVADCRYDTGQPEPPYALRAELVDVRVFFVDEDHVDVGTSAFTGRM